MRTFQFILRRRPSVCDESRIVFTFSAESPETHIEEESTSSRHMAANRLVSPCHDLSSVVEQLPTSQKASLK